MSASVVRFESASKTYHSGPFWAHSATDALHPTDFEIGPEEMVAMVGESGSGKTTFGRLCLGLAEPTTGRVLLEGERFPANCRLLRGRLAAVLQNPSASLDPHLRSWRFGDRAHSVGGAGEPRKCAASSMRNA